MFVLPSPTNPNQSYSSLNSWEFKGAVEIHFLFVLIQTILGDCHVLDI